MVLYLTSSFIQNKNAEAYDKSKPVVSYGFFEDLKREWRKKANVLYVPCDPEASEENEHQLQMVLEECKAAKLPVNEAKILDGSSTAPDMVAWANVIYLAGGHAPTQLAFMKRMRLKSALLGYEGIVISFGAGAVNSAFYVYHMPETIDEANNPNYIRFSDGLDLTNIQMIPKREYIREKKEEGISFFDDVLIPDSFGCRFYLVSDGSYFKVKGGKTTFKGKGEIIEDGIITPLKQGPIVPFMSYIEQPVIRALISEGYDMVVTVYKKDEHCEIYYLKETLSQTFESSRLQYKDICFKISQDIIEEERENYLKEIRLPVILKEMSARGDYVRTFHVDTVDGRRAKNIRAKEIPGYPDWIMIVYIDNTTTIDHDWLTDEYARTGFLERAKVFLSELSANDHYSLVFTNIKGFKAVNELFGTHKGDQIIFQTRDILRKYLKPVIVGRLEGDHFVLITADENLKEKNLRTMCRQVFRIESMEYSFEIHCGIYPINNPRISISQILAGAKLAEKSLRNNSNRNILYAYYDDSMKEDYVKQRFLLSDFERALSENEFEPYYQPVVDTKTGDIVSAEMLIRWKHRDLGMVSPSDFIPIIESEGKTSALDRYMVERGISFIEERTRLEKNVVPCAINLSRVDFYDTVFIEHIFEYIKEKKIDPKMVRFEVTESAYADLESKSLEYLSEMKKQGIQILLDDYGSGMSSLSMLETFDFDIIKLDIGFVRKIGINKKSESIIVSTINLAHSIGAKVTAEGVETEKQLKFLLDADCDYIQGYFFYKPLSEDTFANMLDLYSL
ncbi:EAL domain-containing protein [Butyrivibrio sp. AE3004]|uniref:EAL domain-containing protein n=1 Tax=Butyrivibrio sp. AE3004 TaxID=1506994 RepID=UPI000493CAE0|nr:EAL domain-containing protein [Butyrivibrio sp. AE3004]